MAEVITEGMAEVMKHDCPTCKSGPGVSCRNADGIPVRYPHVRRVRKAQA